LQLETILPRPYRRSAGENRTRGAMLIHPVACEAQISASFAKTESNWYLTDSGFLTTASADHVDDSPLIARALLGGPVSGTAILAGTVQLIRRRSEQVYRHAVFPHQSYTAELKRLLHLIVYAFLHRLLKVVVY
jgi:hypothetical protein